MIDIQNSITTVVRGLAENTEHTYLSPHMSEIVAYIAALQNILHELKCDSNSAPMQKKIEFYTQQHREMYAAGEKADLEDQRSGRW